jgi:hypothetical protein
LILDPGSLTNLLRAIGADNAIRLAGHDALRMIYSPDMTTIPNAGDLPATGWGISTASVPDWQVDRLVPEAFHEVIGRRGAARRASNKFLKHVEVVSPADLRPQSEQEIVSEFVANKAVEELLRYVAPGYQAPDRLIFAVQFDQASGFVVDTKLDMKAISANHRAVYNTASEVTISHLLLALIGVQEDVGAAAYFDSDVTLSPLRAALLQLCGARPVSSEADQKGHLLDVVFNESRAISEAVNSGRVSFSDVLDLAEHAGQFRTWLTGQPPDADLVKAFFQEATRESWADCLPAAAARWLFVTGAGTAAGLAVAGPAGIAAGPALSAADFVAGRIRGRWSPNQFLLRRTRKTLRLGSGMQPADGLDDD